MSTRFHVLSLGARPFGGHVPQKLRKPSSFAATSLTSLRIMANEDNLFKTKGKFKSYWVVSNDPRTIGQAKTVMKNLLQQGMRKSTVDLSGVKLVSEGIIFPFVEPQCFKSAYGWCYRNFLPLLEKAGVHRSLWEWRPHGDPVAEEQTMGDDQGAALPSRIPDPAPPSRGGPVFKLQAVEVTNPGLYPPSVPLKFCRGLQSVKRSCGRWGT